MPIRPKKLRNSKGKRPKKRARIQLSHLHKLLHIENKSDSFPRDPRSTSSAKKPSATYCASISPPTGFLGEETGFDRGPAAGNGSSTPLTGTRPISMASRPIARLSPLKTVKDLVVGCMNLPAMRETYWAGKGKRAFPQQ